MTDIKKYSQGILSSSHEKEITSQKRIPSFYEISNNFIYICVSPAKICEAIRIARKRVDEEFFIHNLDNDFNRFCYKHGVDQDSENLIPITTLLDYDMKSLAFVSLDKAYLRSRKDKRFSISLYELFHEVEFPGHFKDITYRRFVLYCLCSVINDALGMINAEIITSQTFGNRLILDIPSGVLNPCDILLSKTLEPYLSVKIQIDELKLEYPEKHDLWKRHFLENDIIKKIEENVTEKEHSTGKVLAIARYLYFIFAQNSNISFMDVLLRTVGVIETIKKSHFGSKDVSRILILEEQIQSERLWERLSDICGNFLISKIY